MDDLLAVHGHGEATSVEWIDAPHGDLEEFPLHAGGQRGRRRADRAATPSAESVHPADSTFHREAATPPPAGDDTAASGVPKEVPPSPEPLPRRRPGADLGMSLPPEPRATGEPAGNRVILEETTGPESATEPPAADETPSPQAERPNLRPVRTERESPAAPLLSSSESDPRNGHLYIDTAPLLLTFRDRETERSGEQERADDPAIKRPHRRGGRHRRVDPDAAG